MNFPPIHSKRKRNFRNPRKKKKKKIKKIEATRRRRVYNHGSVHSRLITRSKRFTDHQETNLRIFDDRVNFRNYDFLFSRPKTDNEVFRVKKPPKEEKKKAIKTLHYLPNEIHFIIMKYMDFYTIRNYTHGSPRIQQLYFSPIVHSYFEKRIRLYKACGRRNRFQKGKLHQPKRKVKSDVDYLSLEELDRLETIKRIQGRYYAHRFVTEIASRERKKEKKMKKRNERIRKLKKRNKERKKRELQRIMVKEERRNKPWIPGDEEWEKYQEMMAKKYGGDPKRIGYSYEYVEGFVSF